jgi:hypothetical protein
MSYQKQPARHDACPRALPKSKACLENILKILLAADQHDDDDGSRSTHRQPMIWKGRPQGYLCNCHNISNQNISEHRECHPISSAVQDRR